MFGFAISIHALAKRATIVTVSADAVAGISIHALAKRATDQSVYCTPQNYNFNPRPRKEGDKRYKDRHVKRYYFNPRPRKEGDSKKL